MKQQKKLQLDEGFYTVETLIAALKGLPKDAIVTVADCHMAFREVDGKKVALTRCRKLAAIRIGEFDHKRPVMNFTVGDEADSICFFPDKSREIDECKSSESASTNGASSTVISNSDQVSTPSKAQMVQEKPTLSIRSSSRSRGTFHDFMG